LVGVEHIGDYDLCPTRLERCAALIAGADHRADRNTALQKFGNNRAAGIAGGACDQDRWLRHGSSPCKPCLN
jgi:hypothetical protein